MATAQINTFILSNRLFRGFNTYPDLKVFLDAGDVQNHPILTTTYLCAQHAYYFSTSMDSVNKRTIQSELNLLKKIGVKFDIDIALNHALNFTKMLKNPSAKLIWY